MLFYHGTKRKFIKMKQIMNRKKLLQEIQVTNLILLRINLVMRKFTFVLILLLATNIYAQKKYNFGLSVGSDQFYSKNKGYSPMDYNLKNSYNYKIGFFIEKNLKNNDEILIGINYNRYWNNFNERFLSEDIWIFRMANSFYDLDIHYNHLLMQRFKIFLGTNVSFYHFHDKYAGEGYVDDELYYEERNDVTDFNVALNTGVKYEINPNSTIKFEPFVLIGATLLKEIILK